MRYEYDTYEALQKELPPVGSDLVTNRGRVRVLGAEILAQQLLVETEDHRRVLIPAGDVLTVLKRGSDSETTGKSWPEIRRCELELVFLAAKLPNWLIFWQIEPLVRSLFWTDVVDE